MSEPTVEAAPPPIPADLQRYFSPPGKHRRGIKVMVFGPPGGGKSTFLASMPSPKVVVSTGEGGIEPYLEPNDVPFDPKDDPNVLERAVKHALDNENYFQSLIIDPMTAAWEDWMDFWSAKLGGEIQGGDWRKVKGPWKAMLSRLMQSRMHIGFSAWLRDIVYEQAESAPGVKGKLEIKANDAPAVEKSVPYTVDFVLRCDQEKDRKNTPKPIHTITVYKARRPRSVPPSELYVGKVWRFDAKNPVPPWGQVIVPFIQNWSEGAVDYLGMDPREAMFERKDMEENAADLAVGRILRLIDAQTDLGVFANQIWPSQIAPFLDGLTEDRLVRIQNAKDAKKQELLGERK